MAAVDYWDGERRGRGAVGRSCAKHWWFACILAAVVVGCADRGSEDGEDSAAAGPDDQAGELVEPFTEDRELRATRTVAYDTAWSFGGPDDTLLASPHKLDVASDGGLYVLDVRAMKVLRIDGGRLAWAWGSSGQGPGEIGNVRAMTVDPRTDAPFLVDSGNRRLVWLSSDGTLSREQPFAGQALMTEDVVALTDGSGYVASFFGMTETRGVLGIDLMRIPSDGESPAVVTPSWPGFRDLETIQLDMLVFAASGASWGLAFKKRVVRRAADRICLRRRYGGRHAVRARRRLRRPRSPRPVLDGDRPLLGEPAPARRVPFVRLGGRHDLRGRPERRRSQNPGAGGAGGSAVRKDHGGRPAESRFA